MSISPSQQSEEALIEEDAITKKPDRLSEPPVERLDPGTGPRQGQHLPWTHHHSWTSSIAKLSVEQLHQQILSNSILILNVIDAEKYPIQNEGQYDIVTIFDPVALRHAGWRIGVMYKGEIAAQGPVSVGVWEALEAMLQFTSRQVSNMGPRAWNNNGEQGSDGRFFGNDGRKRAHTDSESPKGRDEN